MKISSSIISKRGYNKLRNKKEREGFIMTGLKLVREMLDKKFDKAKKDYAGKEIDEARYNEIKESYKQADLYLKKNGE